MAEELWRNAIIAGLGETSDGVTVAASRRDGPNGDKIVSIEVTDPIRNGRFSIDLLESATDNQVTAAVRAAWKRFVRSHPVTRGARL